MADLFQTGSSWLATQLANYASQSVTLKRGTQSASISATPGGKIELQEADTEFYVERQQLDWLITAAAYKVAGVAVEPKRADILEWTTGGVTHKFVVTAQGNEPVYRFSDRHRVLYRVHTEYQGIG